MVRASSTPGSGLPAFYGGRPIFPEGLPIARPSVPPATALQGDVSRILESGILTNGPYVRELEDRAAGYLSVRHCIAVASCTSGLMLVLRASELTGDVLVPSFTFAATAHAVSWNGLRPVFADIDRSTLTLSPEAVAETMGVRTSAILATHTYGTPCDVEGLDAVARSNGVRLLFDAAHAFGSQRAGVCVGGFGDAEVFSLSPTKVLVAGEGGIISTNDDAIAQQCRIGRDYGNPGNYDCSFVGLNARMSEIHAAMALRSLETLEDRISQRNALASLYRGLLGPIPGMSFPEVGRGDRSTYKDLAVLVDPESFGTDPGWLARALAAEGIETRRYYSPPVHAMRAYRGLGPAPPLPNTEFAAAQALCLPLWTGLTPGQVERVALAIERIREAWRGEGRPLAGRTRAG
ncbi:MAG: DegT/DnrJ/EryC1/StrS family aminotransferase [Actinobacteria bacterium]|nr:MAG: DegT/DnrJ/EryC1/StrS family aminotransferase [Actinomycetota bacterium]